MALVKHQIHVGNMRARITKEKQDRLLKFEEEHAATIKNYDFKLGDLVLVRNTTIEKHLNKKMTARYLGPLIVVKKTLGSRYILAELDGTVLAGRFGQFRVVPYFARESLELPPDMITNVLAAAKKLESLAATKPTYGDNISGPNKDNPIFRGVRFKIPEGKEYEDNNDGSEVSNESDSATEQSSDEE